MEPKLETISSELIEQLAGTDLPAQFAKLYSQHTRLGNLQPGLSSWSDAEADQRVSDIIRLIEAGFIELEANRQTHASSSFKRAAELLEWLNHPGIKSGHYPLAILSGALYQLAGYPARASSVLKKETYEQSSSKIIGAFIKADFKSLLEGLSEFWSLSQENVSVEESIIIEIIRSLGVITSHFRWGKWDDRIVTAQEKLLSASQTMLYGESYFSWITSKTTSYVAEAYCQRMLRKSVEQLLPLLTNEGHIAVETYLRQCFLQNKSLVWPSQEVGIKKILEGESFVLCTPTGSGKTTVAEIAILKALFEVRELSETEKAPLILYLTPSRALAAEVESKLSKVLAKVGSGEIVVTGLYGGTDWGPTDAWLNNDKKTVLICTFEKAEALLRFIGPLFVRRISLAIIDEAHAIYFNENGENTASDSRALRLESFITRLFTFVDRKRVKLIGLSAVAKDIEQPLAKWIANDSNATPAKTEYRSTRQIIGKLEVAVTGNFGIKYDLLDRNPLAFSKKNPDDGPYIMNPVPKDPTPLDWRKGSDEVKLRSSLFWAALHLAQKNDKGEYSSILISITQQIGAYASDLIHLIDEIWVNEQLPDFFSEPHMPDKKVIWEKCLQSCEDYFGSYSREYRLLRKGIVVHHGKMPGIMARLLVQLIEQKIINVVIATSTLSEGVNLPFETVLVPTILRRGKIISAGEFMNLAGRAGRPGVGTEGRTLVMVPKKQKSEREYNELILSIRQSSIQESESKTVSALSALLEIIRAKWTEVFITLDESDFLEWLEQVTPSMSDNVSERDLDQDQDEPEMGKDNSSAILDSSVDALDSFLMSSLVEFEKLNGKQASASEWEELIRSIWKRSFSYYSTAQPNSFEEMLVVRGNSLKENIYSDVVERNKLYRTSLSPQAGRQLIKLYDPIIKHLKTGFEYAVWDKDQKFEYVQKIVLLLGKHPKFNIPDVITKRKGASSSNHVFKWWLNPKGADVIPTVTQVSDWYNFISKNYLYRFNWGFGSIVSLIFDDLHEGDLRETKIEEWPQTGLPWIAFWIKELVTWGTLDPVAAFMLSSGKFTTRAQAELEAAEYYAEYGLVDFVEPNELFNPIVIRDWVLSREDHKKSILPLKFVETIPVQLARDFEGCELKDFRVLPVIKAHGVEWFDCAGYLLAKSASVVNLSNSALIFYDFKLNPLLEVVEVSKY